MTFQFAMNRTCAPQLELRDFLTLAKDAGVSAVEIRNDIEGREFLDGTSSEDIVAALNEADLKVASVNALQRFNEWTSTREKEAAKLFDFAAKLGAPGVVLCPVHNVDHGWSDQEAEKNLRSGLKGLLPILEATGVIGYVEPLGMRGSTMKMQSMAVAAIGDVDGWANYKLCFDTFQFFRCGDTALHPDKIGLAHMSGIKRMDLGPSELSEPDRVLVEESDRVGNVVQLRALLRSGYKGFISMEPFNVGVQQSTNLLRELRGSFDLVSGALA